MNGRGGERFGGEVKARQPRRERNADILPQPVDGVILVGRLAVVELGRGRAKRVERSFQRGPARIGIERGAVELQQPRRRVGGVERRKPRRQLSVQRPDQRIALLCGQHRGDGVQQIEQEILAQTRPEQRGQADDQACGEARFDKGLKRAAVAAIGKIVLEGGAALVIASREIGEHGNGGNQHETFRLHPFEPRDQRVDLGLVAFGCAIRFQHRSRRGGADQRAERPPFDIGDVAAVVAGVEPGLAQQCAADKAGMADQSLRQRGCVSGVHCVLGRGCFRVRRLRPDQPDSREAAGHNRSASLTR